MTKQKTISSLSIAAIALVAAAVPALAQGQAKASSRNATVNGATLGLERTIESNRESSEVRKSRMVTPSVEFEAGDVAHNNKPALALAFKGQNSFTFASNNGSQVSFIDAAPVDPMAKKQFRADENESNSANRVSFVSSRGQKLPE